MNNKQIKSKERVKHLGEVFTRKAEINAMLDLIPEINPKQKFLEPACGNGNFLIEVLKYKLRNSDKSDSDIFWSVASTYACDISLENVLEARIRILRFVKRITRNPELLNACEYVITENIICNDFLNDSIYFNEYYIVDDNFTLQIERHKIK